MRSAAAVESFDDLRGDTESDGKRLLVDDVEVRPMVAVLIGAGIDGRTGQNALFDGRADDADPVPVRFKEVKTFPSGAVLLRYEVEK